MNIPTPFNHKLWEYINNTKHSWLNMLEGGKRGSKNVVNCFAYKDIIEYHPSRLHLIGGVTQSTARINILECDGLGLLNYFEGRCREGKFKDRDCLYVSTLTGEKVIIVAGGENAGSYKYIKGFTLGSVYISEANECNLTFINEAFDRTKSVKNRRIILDYNSKSPEHEFYKEIEELHRLKQMQYSDYGFNYNHTTIADNSSIDDEQLKEILRTYDTKSVWFRRDILGKRCVAKGLIYQEFNRTKHVVKNEKRNYSEYYISMDYGTQNATAMILWALHDNTWIAIEEYYYSGRDENKQKTDEQYYIELINLRNKILDNCMLLDYRNDYEKQIAEQYELNKFQQVIIDPSAASFIATIRYHGELSVRTADNAVLDGIREVSTALQLRLILFNDCCKMLIKETEQYMWDEKAKGEERPLKGGDHMPDSMRYFVKTLKVVRN